MLKIKMLWHNLVLHPLAGMLWFVGLTRAGDWVHGGSPPTEPAPPRNRVEAIIHGPNGWYWAERLLSTEHPANIGAIRCVGGKIEPGEQPREALIRELLEEYSLVVDPTRLVLAGVSAGPRGNIWRYEVGDLCIKEARKSTEGTEELVLVVGVPKAWS